MNNIEFIEKNIIAELSRLGFDSAACNIGAREAIAVFQRGGQTTRKGKIFDECLSQAKIFAKQHNSKKK